MAKQPIVTAMSPLGTFAHTHIVKPDNGYQDSDIDNPKYKVKVLVPKEGPNLEDVTVRTKIDGQWTDVPLNELAMSFAAEVWGKAPKKFANEIVKDGDELAEEKEKFEAFAGHWVIEAKSKFKPKQYNAAKDEVDDGVNAGAGDLGRINFKLFAYGEGAKRGVSLQLRSLQIIEKRAMAGEGSADDFDDDFVDHQTDDAGESFDDSEY